jgi:DNA-binding CsgD family transcriptional regulator
VSRRRGGTRRIAGTHLATLAGRLTPRDRTLLRLLADHQVLTVGHCADLLYGSPETARHRLVSLHRLGAVDRFRPLVGLGEGSAPYHYVLGEAGASVLAAELGVEPHQLGYRRDHALAIAHQPGLKHLLAVNGFFASLAASRTTPAAALVAWWSAARCANQWGKLVRPDGYGRWRDGNAEVDFFLEVDRATEPPHRLAAKLTGYRNLVAATKIATPVLFWFPSPQRETAARLALAASSARALPIATASTTRGRPADPAGPVWLLSAAPNRGGDWPGLPAAHRPGRTAHQPRPLDRTPKRATPDPLRPPDPLPPEPNAPGPPGLHGSSRAEVIPADAADTNKLEERPCA